LFEFHDFSSFLFEKCAPPDKEGRSYSVRKQTVCPPRTPGNSPRFQKKKAAAHPNMPPTFLSGKDQPTLQLPKGDLAYHGGGQAFRL
jgi:hypothetical protein